MPRTWAPIQGPTILLSTGRYYSFDDPDEMSAEEVAHSLANTCRFTGHCREFYSVAQHAVLVSRLVPPEFAWEGLHHDDGEAAMGDMASPLKRLIPEYKTIERRVEKAILAGFGIDSTNMPPVVKHADIVALRTEQRDLMEDRETWTNTLGIEPAPGRVIPVPPNIAKQMYLDRHWELSRRRVAA